MPSTYSTYEAKAKFSELLRKVRAGQRIRITHHGKEIAEIGPVPQEDGGVERRMTELEEAGRLHRHRHHARGTWDSLARRPGALARFLEERE